MPFISEKQNERRQLQRLAAQRQLYAAAKTVLGCQMALLVPFAAAVFLVVTVWPGLKVLVFFSSLILVLLDTYYLTPLQKGYREAAAKIQEAFDCYVLGLPWADLKAEKPVDIGTETQWAAKYQKVAAKFPPLTDWYPRQVDALPASVARALCQSTNFWWDSRQRLLYARILTVVMYVSIVVVVAYGLLSALPLGTLLLIGAAPLLPIITICVRHSREHREAAAKLDKLRDHASSLFEACCAAPNDPALLARSRALQDEIFESRKKNPPLFDWIFKLIRGRYETDMNLNTEQLVIEAQSRLAGRS